MSQCSHATETATGVDIPVIKVNGQLISEQAIAQELQYHPADSAEQAVYKSAEALVVKALLLQQAKALGIGVADQQNESDEEAIIKTLLEQEVSIPEADVEACEKYYQANQERFITPPLMEVDHILLAVAPDDIEGRRSCREHAEELIKQLERNSGLFAEFAREFSACPSKEQGGNLGQLSKGQTVPEFEKQLFRLPVGLAQKPLESRYGFHVVKVVNRIEGQQLPFEACQTKIANYLKDHAYIKAVGQYIDVLMTESEIEGLENPGSGTPLVQ